MSERNEQEREGKEQEREPDEEQDSSAADTLPALPSEDDSALGDTDQHSDA
ncbi:MAG TPA: hypothetical protein VG186_11390 [Solirubrobacteraceae bacterium]|jgi:hypothetical protein|nr:hypothetical protein [Solirubrobacteraceae bacterium]